MKLSTKQFTYHKESRTFVGERSEIPTLGGWITLVSHKTGKEMVYYFVGTDKDAEGEVICWKFNEVKNEEREFFDTRIHVYND